MRETSSVIVRASALRLKQLLTWVVVVMMVVMAMPHLDDDLALRHDRCYEAKGQNDSKNQLFHLTSMMPRRLPKLSNSGQPS
jgi:hypothetical protein